MSEDRLLLTERQAKALLQLVDKVHVNANSVLQKYEDLLDYYLAKFAPDGKLIHEITKNHDIQTERDAIRNGIKALDAKIWQMTEKKEEQKYDYQCIYCHAKLQAHHVHDFRTCTRKFGTTKQ